MDEADGPRGGLPEALALQYYVYSVELPCVLELEPLH